MRMHISASIRGMLNWDRRYTQRHMRGFKKDDGQPYTSIDQFRNDLMDLLAQGHELLPSVGCDNFDPKEGCLGHPDREPVAASAGGDEEGGSDA